MTKYQIRPLIWNKIYKDGQKKANAAINLYL